jgi:uncharacterized protein (DUF697 family)
MSATVAADAVKAPASPEERLAAASKIISGACAWSGASGLIPIPYLDIIALGAVQATMVHRIARLYGETISSEAARSLVAVLLGIVVPGTLGGAAMGAGFKLLPGFGYAFGAVTLAATGAAATYAIGKVFVGHFEGGGTLASFRPEAVKADLAREFAAAKARSTTD